MRHLTSITFFLVLGILAAGCLEDDSPRATDDAAQLDALVDAGSGPASSGAFIGSAGGVVAIDGVTLRIPEGALDAEVEIRLEALESTSALHRLQSVIYQFSPAGLTFLRPVEVEMDFVGSGEWAQLFWSRADAPGYEALDTEIRANVAIAQLTHFSSGFVGFELAAEPDLLEMPCNTEPFKEVSGNGTTRTKTFRNNEPSVLCVETWTTPGANSDLAVDGHELVMEPAGCGVLDAVLMPIAGTAGGKAGDDDQGGDDQGDDDQGGFESCEDLEVSRGLLMLLPGRHSLTLAMASGKGRAFVRQGRLETETSPSPHNWLRVDAPLSTHTTLVPGSEAKFGAMVEVLTGGHQHRQSEKLALRFEFEFVDASSLQVVRTLTGSVDLEDSKLRRRIPISVSWDGTDALGDLVPDGEYLYRVRVTLTKDDHSRHPYILDSVTSKARSIRVGEHVPAPAILEAATTLDVLEAVLANAMPPHAAYAELEPSVELGVNGLRDEAVLSIGNADLPLRVINQPRYLPEVLVQPRLARAVDALQLARSKMWTISDLLWPHLYPDDGEVLYLPRFVVPASALATATFLDGPLSLPDMGSAGGSRVAPTNVFELAQTLETESMVVLAERKRVNTVVLSDFVVVDSPLETVTGEVVLGRQMWVAVGATARFENVELLKNAIFYDRDINPDFSPLMLGTHVDPGAVRSAMTGFDTPFDPNNADYCQGCPSCCNTNCTNGAFALFQLAQAAHAYEFCAPDLFQLQSLTPLNPVTTERFASFAAEAWLDNPAALFGGPLGGLPLPPSVSPKYGEPGCDPIPPGPGGGGVCMNVCAQSDDCGMTDPDGPGGTPGTGGDACAGGAVLNWPQFGDCPATHCDPPPDAEGLMWGRWNGFEPGLQQGDFLSGACLAGMWDGELPAGCEIGSSLTSNRQSVSIQAQFFDDECTANPSCVTPEMQDLVICDLNGRCMSCDPLEHCYETSGPDAYSSTADDWEPTDYDLDVKREDAQDTADTGDTGTDVEATDLTPSKVPPADLDSSQPSKQDSDKKRKEASGAKSADPVSLGNGELFQEFVDLDGAPAGFPISLVRTYRSDDPFAGVLGRDWEHNLEQRLLVVDTRQKDAHFPDWCYQLQPLITCVYHYTGDGQGGLYMLDPSRPKGTFVPQLGHNGLIRYKKRNFSRIDSRAVFVLRTANGMVTEFDRTGLLLSKTAPSGARATYHYDAEDQLIAALDEQGHGLRFEYGWFGLLSAVEDDVEVPGAGRRVEYCYDLALVPQRGTFAGNTAVIQHELERRFGTLPPCWNLTAAPPSLDEIAAILQCVLDDGETGEAVWSCVDDKLICPTGETCLSWPGPLRTIIANDVISSITLAETFKVRSLAFLKEVREWPAGSFLYTGGALPDDAVVTRFSYSTVPTGHVFLEALSRSVSRWFKTGTPTDTTPAACTSPTLLMADMLFEQAVVRSLGKLTAVSQRVGQWQSTRSKLSRLHAAR